MGLPGTKCARMKVISVTPKRTKTPLANLRRINLPILMLMPNTSRSNDGQSGGRDEVSLRAELDLRLSRRDHLVANSRLLSPYLRLRRQRSHQKPLQNFSTS